MFHLGKCPKCEKIVGKARLEHMDVSDGTMIVKAFSASCPHCHTILGAFVDPRPTDNWLIKIGKALNIR